MAKELVESFLRIKMIGNFQNFEEKTSEKTCNFFKNKAFKSS